MVKVDYGEFARQPLQFVESGRLAVTRTPFAVRIRVHKRSFAAKILFCGNEPSEFARQISHIHH